ncbi:MAG: copper amine oxidase N-terminal domain-containing protein [Bacillota bacterium]
MKKHLKKQAAALLVSALAVSGGAVYAAPSADVSQGGDLQQAEVISAILNYSVTINGKDAKNTGFMNQESKQIMLPLREISEALGYEIKWNAKERSAELTKQDTPVWTLVQTDKDQYNVNKMNVELGSAPVNNLGNLYVPAKFFSDVLHHSVAVDGARVSITSEAEDVKTMTSSGVITAVHNDADRKAVHINGAGTEGTILNVDENTVILNAAGDKIELKDLSLGLDIDVEHSLAMTMSLPGQTYAYEIKVKKDFEVKDWIGTSGSVTEVASSDAGTKITVKGFGMTETSPEEVVLNLSPETIIVDQDGKEVKASELKKEDKLLAFYSPVLTKSLPPIGNASKLVLVK